MFLSAFLLFGVHLLSKELSDSFWQGTFTSIQMCEFLQIAVDHICLIWPGWRHSVPGCGAVFTMAAVHRTSTFFLFLLWTLRSRELSRSDRDDNPARTQTHDITESLETRSGVVWWWAGPHHRLEAVAQACCSNHGVAHSSAGSDAPAASCHQTWNKPHNSKKKQKP